MSGAKGLPVTAVAITYNAQLFLRRCLESVAWADEIVIVDAFSTDRTAEICNDPAAPWAGKLRFFQRKWDNFRDQRNYALDQCTHDWVLVIDSDEKCTDELRDRVRALLQAPGGPPLPCYKVRRVEYFLGKEIRWGIWNPSYQDRFFNRNGIRYVNEVHEYPAFPVTPGRIEEPFLHHPDFNPQQFLEKMVKYTAVEARDRYERGTRTNWFRLITAFPFQFWKTYIYYKGYRDGMFGFVISVLEGISRTVRHVRLWELQLAEKEKRLR